MQILSLVLYVAAFFFATTVLIDSLRRSEFGVLLLLSEFLFFVLGASVYPILLILKFIEPGVLGYAYLQRNQEPGLLMAFHIFLYSVFSLIGYRVGFRRRSGWMIRVATTIQKYFQNPEKIFASLVIFGGGIYLLFASLVGVDVALINAAAARSGYMEGFGDDVKYLFLKTLASISLFAVCFAPWILIEKKSGKRYIYIVGYILLVLFAYLNSISRSLLLISLITPYMVFLRNKMSFRDFIRLIPVFFVGVAILIYGKNFGHYVSGTLQGYDSEIASSQVGQGFLVTVFQNLEYVWFSVGAGIENFFDSGPLLPLDVFYSFIGFVPSGVLTYFGIGDLYYGNATTRLPCVNAEIFGFYDCTVPPLWIGFSAYTLPVAGAVVFGFWKYYIYGLIERIWILAKNYNYKLTWIPYFLFMITSSFFTLIPNLISRASFVVMLVCVFMVVRYTLSRAVR